MDPPVKLAELVPPDLRLDMGPLGELALELSMTDAMKEVARTQLREGDAAATAAALKRLRQMLNDEPDLVVPPDDTFLTAALRPCHWNVEGAFQKLRNFYAFKARHPHVGRALTGDRIPPVASSGVVCILPRRDQHGRRILLLRTGHLWHPKKVPMDDVLAAVIMFLQVALMEPNTQVAGVVILWDLDGLSLSQVLKFTPSFAKMLLHFIQDCIPLRIKAFHFINQNSLFDMAFNIFKPFLRDKLRSRLFLHGRELSSLGDHIDAKVLPTEYGGLHDFRLDPDAHVAVFRKCDHFFEVLGTYGYTKPPK